VRNYKAEIPGLNFLHIKDFSKQLDYFSREFGFIEKQTFFNSVIKDRTSRKGVVLTFDDGLRDHVDFVFPELKKRGLWGIFYIPGFVYQNRQMLPVQRIQYLLAKYGGTKVLLSIKELKTILKEENILEKIHAEKIYESHDDDEDSIQVKSLVNYFLDSKLKKVISIKLMEFFEESEQGLIDQFYLSPKEIKFMHDEGMVIGSHGMTHEPMINLTPKQSDKEIKNSFNVLENITGPIKNRTFCYPHGLPHTFSKETEVLLEKNKVEFSFAVESRDVTDRDLNFQRQSLPRYDCNEFQHGKAYRHNF
jgi:peptidoglycan/xylan/chitin deacetylase (PgdA/CDA1 family)